VEWGLALLGWGLLTAVVGEALRAPFARWVTWWSGEEPLKRGLIDLYLGGATLYLLAALSIGAFIAPAVAGIVFAGLAAVVLRELRAGVPSARERARSFAASWARPLPLAALASAVGLFVIEIAAAVPAGTGNTFDSSVLTLFTSLLLSHGSVPTSLVPISSGGILYPQGTAVWLGWAQLLFGLPAARTSLLVTPFFLALTPLAGFVLGRELLGDERGALAFAVALAWLGPGTRAMVGGSNDFVFSVPLVLLLAAQLPTWVRSSGPSWGDAVGFGILTGYSASMNPTGAEWLLPTLLVVGVVARRRALETLGRWLSRWGAAVGTTLLGILPSLYVLALGRSSPYYVPGAVAPPPGTVTALPLSDLVPRVDPFLLGSGDQALSSVPFVRGELLLLLVVGVGLFVLLPSRSPLEERLRPFRNLALAAILVILGLLLLLVSAGSGFPFATAFQNLTSADELSQWLFLFYGLVAAVPVVVAFETLGEYRRASGQGLRDEHVRAAPVVRRPLQSAESRGYLAAGVALVLIVPAVVLTPISLSPQLANIYSDFGNVSAADFALLEYAGAHLPDGARVLVAPGSAAEFLPGYAPHIVLLYPMTTGWPWVNSSYRLLVRELTNGTLDAAGFSAFSALNVTFVAVTMNNTVLWPAFSPGPLLAHPATFSIVWHEADAYLFARG